MDQLQVPDTSFTKQNHTNKLRELAKDICDCLTNLQEKDSYKNLDEKVFNALAIQSLNDVYVSSILVNIKENNITKKESKRIIRENHKNNLKRVK